MLVTYLSLNFFYSLGEEYTNLFFGNGNLTGSPQSLEKWHNQSKIFLCGAIEMSRFIMSKVFTCEDLCVLSPFLTNLKCLYNICRYFACKVSSSNVCHKIDYKNTYTPEYLQSVQMDCFKLVAEISFLLGKIKPLLAEFEEENNVIHTMRIGLLISRYFQAFV